MLDILGVLGYSVRFTLGLKEERTLFQSGRNINIFSSHSTDEEFTKVGGAHHEKEPSHHRLVRVVYCSRCLWLWHGNARLFQVRSEAEDSDQQGRSSVHGHGGRRRCGNTDVFLLMCHCDHPVHQQDWHADTEQTGSESRYSDGMYSVSGEPMHGFGRCRKCSDPCCRSTKQQWWIIIHECRRCFWYG